MTTYTLWTLLFLHAVGLISTILLVGRERKPMTPGAAAVTATIQLAVLAAIVLCLRG